MRMEKHTKKIVQPALLHPTAHTAKSPQWISTGVVAPPIPFGNPTVTRACRRFGRRSAGGWLEGVVGEVRMEPTEGETTTSKRGAGTDSKGGVELPALSGMGSACCLFAVSGSQSQLNSFLVPWLAPNLGQLRIRYLVIMVSLVN